MPRTSDKAPRRRRTASAPGKKAGVVEPNASARTHAQRRDEAERRLLAAAVAIVSDRGIEGTTLADVGVAAGYSRGLPAHYFGRKSDLVAAVASYIADGF